MSERIQDVLRELAARREGEPPSPGGWYSPEGDCVFFFNEDVVHKAVRVDGFLTLYRALDGGRIVGAKVKGIKSLPPHDLIGMFLHRTREIELVAIITATYYRERERVRPEDMETRTSRYLEALQSLRGEVSLEDALCS